MRLLLINHYGLDSGAPTGRILGELGEGLRLRGHEVVYATLPDLYGKPRRGVRRILYEAFAHLVLLGKSLGGSKVDAVISMTSPACLAVNAAFVAKLHGAKHYHWAMDLYPDVGVRLGELKDGLLVRILGGLMRWAYQSAARVVALDEDMREYLKRNYGVDSVVVEPFPPEVAWPTDVQSGPTKRWLYSGNFGRAHEIEVLFHVQRKLEEKGLPVELVLQGQGPQFASSRKAAAKVGVRNVQWREPAAQEALGQSLCESDVLVVTRKPEMKGLLLPSKLMLAELSGKSVLWIGDTDGETARRLKSVGRHGVFSMEEAEAMASWLQQLFEDKSRQAIAPKPTSKAREEAIQIWETLLRQ